MVIVNIPKLTKAPRGPTPAQCQPQELDALLNVCLAFIRENPAGTYFMVANVARRDGGYSSIPQAKKMLDLIV
mgnify:CR=1 FL=1